LASSLGFYSGTLRGLKAFRVEFGLVAMSQATPAQWKRICDFLEDCRDDFGLATLDSMSVRRYIGIMCFLHKQIVLKCTTPSALFYEYNRIVPTRTTRSTSRSHAYQIICDLNRTDISAYRRHARWLTGWNSIPDAVMSSDLTVFKLNLVNLVRSGGISLIDD